MQTGTVYVIKGDPGGPHGKWEEVQAIQHEPFIFIMVNGSRWAGQEAGDIEELLGMLKEHPLDRERFEEPFCTVDPCRGERNPDYHLGSNQPEFIDGPRLYACDGVVRYFGNFLTYSHGFSIDTNHKPTIEALNAAIEANKKLSAEDAKRELRELNRRK